MKVKNVLDLMILLDLEVWICVDLVCIETACSVAKQRGVVIKTDALLQFHNAVLSWKEKLILGYLIHLEQVILPKSLIFHCSVRKNSLLIPKVLILYNAQFHVIFVTMP